LNLYAFQIRTRMHMMIPITFKQNTQTSYWKQFKKSIIWAKQSFE
jgi:hypothetical protein